MRGNGLGDYHIIVLMEIHAHMLPSFLVLCSTSPELSNMVPGHSRGIVLGFRNHCRNLLVATQLR